ncbi:hypothetical protein C8F01DRAFT_1108817 [Mycena amicta]|nr:hypothetical protein C8F01DRAFT_1108817 [Mycena amicta]
MPHNRLDEGRSNEQQLRDLYDADEIERFLSLFSAHVSEVSVLGEDPPLSEEDVQKESSLTISHFIAARYITPLLPNTNSPPPLFTLGRLRLTTERFYLSTWPAYAPFFTSLVALARWDDRRNSSIYCLMYWTLWHYNLLLPSLVLRILYSLLRRKIFPYPTLTELIARREEIDRSNEFGREVTARFSATSSLGIRELWRLFKVFNKPKKAKAKPLVDSNVDGDFHESLLDQEAATVLDSDKLKESSQENDVKRVLVKVFADLAELHERVKNIFIWRRPASSRSYAIILFIVFLVALLVPARYIAKLVYLVCGILYWHVTPVITALPPHERARLPPAFADAPTDAEYAMELISRRVAAGLDVRPSRSRTLDSATMDEESNSIASEAQRSGKSDVDWKKWAERAASGRSWMDDGKRVLNGAPSRPSSTAAVETHTFPAQHTSAPGLITLTKDRLFFTSLVSSSTKLEFPLSNLRSVTRKKKHGLFNSLAITWITDEGTMQQEKFMWVGARDELFARLIGTVDGKRLITG